MPVTLLVMNKPLHKSEPDRPQFQTKSHRFAKTHAKAALDRKSTDAAKIVKLMQLDCDLHKTFKINRLPPTAAK